MTKQPQMAPSSERRAGFALVYALIIAGAVCALAIAAAAHRRGLTDDVFGARQSARLEAIAEAGLFRVIHAIEAENDPLRQRLLRFDGPVPWSYGKASVALELYPESAKLDLNRGDSTLLPVFLAAVEPSPLWGSRILSEVLRRRALGQRIATPIDLLDLCDRYGDRGERMRRWFTIETEQTQVLQTPRSLREARFPAGYVPGREQNLYTIRADVVGPTEGASGRMSLEITVVVLPRAPFVRILSRRHAAAAGGRPCGTS